MPHCSTTSSDLIGLLARVLLENTSRKTSTKTVESVRGIFPSTMRHSYYEQSRWGLANAFSSTTRIVFLVCLLLLLLLSSTQEVTSFTLGSWLQQPRSRTTFLKDSPDAAAASFQNSLNRGNSTFVHGVPTSSSSVNNNHDATSPTAPEVEHWTEIMSASLDDDDPNTPHSTAEQQPWELLLSEYDLQQIDLYWDRIMPRVSYLGTAQASQIYQALCVAYRAHRGQMRKSGEPFIIHPVEVALLLAGLKMDGETVIAGLLHDTVEDTDLTFPQIEALFGTTVKGIVEGETKVSKLPKLGLNDYADEQAENLRQMFVAMTDDYRIIIVKLADRLHNMRTLHHMKPEKQIKISRETLDIFAPLAHRMGIWTVKAELEDLSFSYLYPQEYKRLGRRLQEHQEKYEQTLEKAQKIVQSELNQDSTLKQKTARVEVFGRTKEIYSLWHKMEVKGERNLDRIVDVVALRVIITPTEDEESDSPQKDRGVWLCYHVLGLVQHLPGFTPVPTRVKDYISFPKPNGYQSLHTALNLDGQTIEVQIRTSLMHQVAEYGMASHWAYTDAKKQGRTDLFNTPWLSSIKEWQNDMISSRDFVDSVRRELLGKRVFVFLRNGKILNLARGATVIDAAFQIHSEIGLTMHGAEINGKPVPFSYQLQNGDVVSILTGQGKPQTDWMRYAKIRSSRSKLRSYFRTRQKESLRDAGRIMLFDYLARHSKLIEDSSFLDYEFRTPDSVEDLAQFLPGKSQFSDVDELLVAVGKEHERSMLHTAVSQIFLVPKRVLIESEGSNEPTFSARVISKIMKRREKADAAEKVVSMGKPQAFEPKDQGLAVPRNLHTEYSVDSLLAGLNVPHEFADPDHICNDCLPVFGDQVVGTRPPDQVSITTVHRIGCPHAQRAINSATAPSFTRAKETGGESASGSPGIDSVSLRQKYASRLPSGNYSIENKYLTGMNNVPVRLEWSDMDRDTNKFLTEIGVFAQDRKLLLADCSEVVSERAEIVKTGSITTNEHATLIFLVEVNGIEEVQALMDALGQIRSVLSVERHFGSELR